MKGEGGAIALGNSLLNHGEYESGPGTQSYPSAYWGRCASKFGEPLSVFAADRL